MSISFVIAVVGSAFSSGFVAAMSGMGESIMFQMVWIFLGLFLANVGDLTTALAVITVCNVVSGGGIALLSWKLGTIRWDLVMAMWPMLNACVFIGNYLAVTLDEHFLQTILGVLFVAFGLGTLIYLVYIKIQKKNEKVINASEHSSASEQEERYPPYYVPKPSCDDAVSWLTEPRTWGGWLTGGLWGLLSGLFGTGGPPVVYYFALMKISKEQLRATITTTNALSIPFRFWSAYVNHLFVLSEWPSYIGACIACFIGLYFGNIMHTCVDGYFIRLLLYYLVIWCSFILIEPTYHTGLGQALYAGYLIGTLCFFYLLYKWWTERSDSLQTADILSQPTDEYQRMVES